MYWIAKPFVLPLQLFFITKNNTLFQKNSNETRRIWGRLAAPDFANSGKNMCIFLVVVVAVVVVVVVAVDIVEDDAGDDVRRR